MKVKLTCLNRTMPRIQIDVRQRPMVIGRGPGADIQIENSLVSRHHCRICNADNKLVVKDLESRFGTLVNLDPVEESQLRSGDMLTLGPVSFRVSISGQWLSSIRRLFHTREKADFADADTVECAVA